MTGVIAGDILALAHLCLGRTRYLAVPEQSLAGEWPFFLAITLIVLGLALNTWLSSPGRRRVVLMVSTGVLALVAAGAALLGWLLTSFGVGYAGGEDESTRQWMVTVAYTASWLPLLSAFAGSIIASRTHGYSIRQRVSRVLIVSGTIAFLSIVLIIVARSAMSSVSG